MNLSTARSEKRAKEVGVRKSMGSLRRQLIVQFFSESLMIVSFAFVLALVFVVLSLPLFNEVADKRMIIPWNKPVFWVIGVGFTLVTGLIAGSYPALYLSSFQPVKVLKGKLRVGKLALLPRKVLVVLQFTVSVVLIIGTIVVFRQIQYAKDRPIGYDRNGLIYSIMKTPDIVNHYDAVKNDVINSGAAIEMTASQSPVTEVWSNSSGFTWKGKDPNSQDDFGIIGVFYDYGKTIGWQFTKGRDFSKEFKTDTTAFVINEAAAEFMGLKDPVGEIIGSVGGPERYKIVGVVKNMVMSSPYNPVKPTLFYLNSGRGDVITVKLNPKVSSKESLVKIETIFKKYNPAVPFEYKFADFEYNKKFGAEERIGKLSSVFACLAVFISCLGLFGLASFTAEQRTKEIGVRKVLGASVMNLWGLLSKDFVKLVIISCLIAIPIAYYFMHEWLQRYEYRSTIAWWIFIATVIGAMMITLLTVSFQAVKAALANPVKSLRTE
ncbi:FtsX-like permease family protein [compost metagenome]